MTSLTRVDKYVGEANVPQDVKRRRRQVHDIMRRMGAPVIIKEMYTDEHVQQGIAKVSPNWEDPYGQVRNNDNLSYGIGFVSVEESEDEWITPTGVIVKSPVSPGAGHVRAPKYRGFGPGYLTYIIEPDVALDFFKLDSSGVLIKVQNATAQAAWYPDINDNDLIVNVELDNQGLVVDVKERFRAKAVNPISMRGRDNRGRREQRKAEGGNRHVINQTFEMSLVPQFNILYEVDVDR